MQSRNPIFDGIFGEDPSLSFCDIVSGFVVFAALELIIYGHGIAAGYCHCGDIFVTIRSAWEKLYPKARVPRSH